jgi:hypothetical protein
VVTFEGWTAIVGAGQAAGDRIVDQLSATRSVRL